MSTVRHRDRYIIVDFRGFLHACYCTKIVGINCIAVIFFVIVPDEDWFGQPKYRRVQNIKIYAVSVSP